MNFFKSVNTRQSCRLMHFAHLANILLQDEGSEWDNHVLACNLAKYLPIYKKKFIYRLSNKPVLIWSLTTPPRLKYVATLIWSLAVLDPRVGHTMDVLSPFIPVLCHFDWLFHGESCPRLDVVHPGRAWPSSPSCTWHCSLHYLFLQATPLFPHCVTIVC